MNFIRHCASYVVEALKIKGKIKRRQVVTLKMTVIFSLAWEQFSVLTLAHSSGIAEQIK